MMDQLSLPFSGRTRATRERSRRAAEKAAKRTNAKQREILRWLAECGDRGSTDNETIAWVMSQNGSPNGPRARRGELEDKGFVVESGEERDGSTVWLITEAGLAHLAGGTEC